MAKSKVESRTAKSHYTKFARVMAAFTASLLLVSSNLAYASQSNGLALDAARADMSRQEWRQHRHEARDSQIRIPESRRMLHGKLPIVTPRPHAPVLLGPPIRVNNDRKEHRAQVHAAKQANRLSNFVVQENAGQLIKLDNGANLDLTASDRNITLGDKLFANGGFATIEVGGEKKNVYAGSKVTAAEYVAAKQVLNGGNQQLTVAGNGIATGGTVDLGQVAATKNTMKAESLTVAQGVTAVGDLDKHSAFKLSGDLNNYGSVYAVNTGHGKRGADIAADNITNQEGALISSAPGAQSDNRASQIDLTLRADSDFTNLGTVESSGDLTISAGNSIKNGSSASISADQNLNLISPNVNNAGDVSSAKGDITLDTPVPAVLNVDNNGGNLSANGGAINVRAPGYEASFDSNVIGGNLLSKELNLNSGQGLTTVNVEDLTGTIHGTGEAAHVSAHTENLNLGEICLTGDPTFYNTGNINIGGNISVAERLAILAEGNITSNAGVNLIEARQVGGNGFDINIIAGFNLTSAGPSTTTIPGAQINPGDTVVVDQTGAVGGDIDLSASTGLQILAHGTGVGSNGGTVRIIAFPVGIGSGGNLRLPTDSFINTSGNGAGATNGDIFVNSGPGHTLTAGGMLASGGAGTTGGRILVQTGLSGVTLPGGVTFDSTGTITSGNFVLGFFSGATGNLTIGDGVGAPENIIAHDTIDINAGVGGLTLNLGASAVISTQGGDIDIIALRNLAITAASITTTPLAGNGGDVALVADGDPNPPATGFIQASGVAINTSGAAGGDAGTVFARAGNAAGQVLQLGNITALGVNPITVDINGGGGDVTVGTINAGVSSVDVTTAVPNANINLGGNITGAAFINLQAAGTGVINTPVGGVSLTTNSLNIGSNMNAGAGTVVIKPFTDGTSIGVSGAGGTLNVSAVELGRITAGTVEIGDRTLTGDITVSGAINVSGAGPAGAYNLTFKNAGNFTSAGQTITLGTRTLTVDVGGTITTGTTSGTSGDLIITSAGTINIGATTLTGAGSDIILNSTAGGINVLGALQADPIVMTSALDITLNADVTADDGIIMISNQNILTTAGGVDINGGSATTSGGPVVLAAGAAFTINANDITINGASGVAGFGDIDLRTTPLNSFTSASTFAGGSGGNVTLIAFNNGVGTGDVLLPNAVQITTNGTGAANGNIAIVAGDTAGTSIQLGNSVTGFGTIGTGTVDLRTATPNGGVAISTVAGSVGNYANGAFFGGASQAAGITAGTVSTAGAAVNVLSGGALTVGDIGTFGVGAGNGGNVTITANSAAPANLGNVVATSSFSAAGNGGDVSITQSGGGGIVFTSLGVNAGAGFDGNGGLVDIQAGTGALSITFALASAQSGAGGADNAGAVTINAGGINFGIGSSITANGSGLGGGGGGIVSITTTQNVANATLNVGGNSGEFFVSANGLNGDINLTSARGINFNAGGSYTVGSTDLISGNGNDIVFNTSVTTTNIFNANSAGAITGNGVAQITGGTDLNLTAVGSITTAAGARFISGQQMVLTSTAGNLGGPASARLFINANLLEAHANAGFVFISELNSVSIGTNPSTTSGNFNLLAGGNIDIRADVTAASIFLTTGNTTAITRSTGSGVLNGTLVQLVASNPAGGSIGSAAQRIFTNTTTLIIGATGGSSFVTEADSVNLGLSTVFNDYQLNAGGTVNVNGTITADPITIVTPLAINLNADLVANDGILLVAGQNIQTTLAGVDINGGSAVDNGGAIVMVAGAAFTENVGNVIINGPSATGGNVDLQTVAIQSQTSASTFGNGSGGNVTLVAYQNSGANGNVLLPLGLTVTTGGNGTGSNGFFSAVADATIGASIQVGNINTTGGLSGSGFIDMRTLDVNAPVQIQKGALTGQYAFGAFFSVTNLDAGITGGALTTNGANITVFSENQITLGVVNANGTTNGGFISISGSDGVTVGGATGNITANGLNGNGGQIQILSQGAGDIVINPLGTISADGNNGDGGFIVLQANSGDLILDTGSVSANANSGNFDGGFVFLGGAGLQILGGSLSVSADGAGSGNGGFVGVQTFGGSAFTDLNVGTAVGEFTVSADGTLGGISIFSATAVNVNAGGSITADAVTLTSQNGADVTLNVSVTGTTTLSLFSDDGLHLNGTAQATGNLLTANVLGDITTAPGARFVSGNTMDLVSFFGNIGTGVAARVNIDASDVTANAAGGSVFLNELNTVIIDLNPSSALTTWDIQAPGNITSSATGDITATDVVIRSTSGSLSLSGDINGSNSVTLRSFLNLTNAAAADVNTFQLVLVSDFGNVGTSLALPFNTTVPFLTAQALFGSVFLDNANTGNVVIQDFGGFTNTASNVGTWSLVAANAIGGFTFTAPGTDIAAGHIRIESTNGGLGLAGDLTGASSITLVSAGNIDNGSFSGAITPFLTLTSTLGNIGTSAVLRLQIDASILVANATAGSVFLFDPNNLTLGAGASGAANTFDVLTGGNLNVTSSITSTAGNVILNADTNTLNIGANVSAVTGVTLSANSINFTAGSTIAGGTSVALISNVSTTGAAGVDVGLIGDDSISANRNIQLDGTFIATAGNAGAQINLQGVTSSDDISLFATFGSVSANGAIVSGANIAIGAQNPFTTLANITATGNVDIINNALTNNFTITGASVSILSQVGSGLTINGTGTLTATSGAVNITATDNNLDFFGAQTFNGTANLNVDPFQSILINNGAVVTGNDTVNLNTCSLILQGNGVITGNPLNFNCPQGAGTIANSSGNVDLSGVNLVFSGQSFAIIASGNILANGETLIDLSNGGGAGGNLLVVAGFDFTPATPGQVNPPNPAIYTFGSPSATGGNIDFTGLNIVTSGGNGDAGNVTLVAKSGTPNTGFLTVGTITATATNGVGGDVLLIGQGGVTTGVITNTGTGGSGTTTMAVAQPSITGGTIQVLNGEQGGTGQFTFTGPPAGAGTIANSIGSVDLPTNLVFFGTDLTIIARDNINTTGATLIDLSNTGGGAGTLTLIAGFNFAPPTSGQVQDNATLFTVGAPTAGGGNINLSGVDILLTGSTNGGNLVAVANGNGTTTGLIALGDIDTTGVVNNGSVNIIAEGGINIATIDSAGGLGGDINLLIAQPQVVGPAVTIQNGTVLTGAFSAGASGIGTVAVASATAGNSIVIQANAAAGITTQQISAVQDIDITNTGSITIAGNLLATNGSIDITANNIVASAQVLTINAGVNITAETAINIINTGIDSKIDMFILNAGSSLNTTAKTAGLGDISLRLGAVVPPLPTNKLNKRFLVTETGGVLTLFGRKPRGINPQNIITALGADINISSSVKGKTFLFNGGVSVIADPPVAPGTPTYVNGRLVGDSTRSANSTESFTEGSDVITALNLLSGSSVDQLQNGTIVSTATGLDTMANVSNVIMENVNAAATNKTNTVRTETHFGALCQQGEDNSYIVSAGGPTVEAEASICTDLDLGVTADGVPQGYEVGPRASLPAPGSHSNKVVIKQGNVLFVPFCDTQVETPHGLVNIKAKSVALLSISNDRLAVYDIDDSSKGAVTVEANGETLALAPGSHVTLAGGSFEFAQVNAIEAIPHRNVKTRATKAGVKVHTSEFSVAAALVSVKPLKAVMGSNHPQAKKVRDRLMKTTAIVLHLGGQGDYQHYFKPAMTAMAQ